MYPWLKGGEGVFFPQGDLGTKNGVQLVTGRKMEEYSTERSPPAFNTYSYLGFEFVDDVSGGGTAHTRDTQRHVHLQTITITITSLPPGPLSITPAYHVHYIPWTKVAFGCMKCKKLH